MFKKKFIISYVITFVVLTLVFSWKAALILMFGVSIHELGHLYFGKRYGLETNGFILIPFVGGVSFISGQFKSAYHRCIMLIGGPLAGSLLGVPFYFTYCIFGNIYCGQVALLLFLFNAFNLLPLSFLDGGQLLGCWLDSINETVAMVVSIISYIIAIPILFFFNPAIAVLIGFFGFGAAKNSYKMWETRHTLKKLNFSDQEINEVIYKPSQLSRLQLIQVLCLYFGLAIILFGQIFYLTSVGINYESIFVR